ncbi:MAG: type II toxin-antitoxin system HigB family toxin [Undibacterium sp.]|nr:type II toxin-antitoxin system HigB family toxin [Undibacterium sp.]
MSWHKLLENHAPMNFHEVKQICNSADYSAPYTIFDVGGNNFRVIAVIHYNRQKLYIREVFTHAEYDRWNKATRNQ